MTTVPKRAKLTKGYVDKIGPGRKDEFHWDTDVKGFGVRVTPRGKLTFIVQGRVEGTAATPRITIGPYGVFTVDQAREQAREHLRTMRQGHRSARPQEAGRRAGRHAPHRRRRLRGPTGQAEGQQPQRHHTACHHHVRGLGRQADPLDHRGHVQGALP